MLLEDIEVVELEIAAELGFAALELFCRLSEIAEA
jgi:hypothetical protein